MISYVHAVCNYERTIGMRQLHEGWLKPQSGKWYWYAAIIVQCVYNVIAQRDQLTGTDSCYDNDIHSDADYKFLTLFDVL